MASPLNKKETSDLIVRHEPRDYAKSSFIKKKVERAREVIAKNGLPKAGKLPKKK
ncbi:MAG TPA: hypothetical protein VGN00_30010 [Puia sp.]|jgi:hypothetical protein